MWNSAGAPQARIGTTDFTDFTDEVRVAGSIREIRGLKKDRCAAKNLA
jgi:hypothetical protein